VPHHLLLVFIGRARRRSADFSPAYSLMCEREGYTEGRKLRCALLVELLGCGHSVEDLLALATKKKKKGQGGQSNVTRPSPSQLLATRVKSSTKDIGMPTFFFRSMDAFISSISLHHSTRLCRRVLAFVGIE
jgi:hypothetical protein